MAQLHLSISDLVGKRLRRIGRVLYQRGSDIDAVDGPLELEVDGRTFLLDGAPDGESLRVREGAWEDPFKEPLSDENLRYIREHGKWHRIDCSQHEHYDTLVGQELREVGLLENEHRRIAGVRLSTNGRSMWFVVEGDECHVYWAHPIGFFDVR
jgi:hypothetical protein